MDHRDPQTACFLRVECVRNEHFLFICFIFFVQFHCLCLGLRAWACVVRASCVCRACFLRVSIAVQLRVSRSKRMGNSHGHPRPEVGRPGPSARLSVSLCLCVSLCLFFFILTIVPCHKLPPPHSVPVTTLMLPPPCLSSCLLRACACLRAFLRPPLLCLSYVCMFVCSYTCTHTHTHTHTRYAGGTGSARGRTRSLPEPALLP